MSLLVHGHWLVAAVTVRPQARLSFPILKNAELPGPAQSIPASTASVTIAGTSYHFGMAQAPDSAYSVGIVENVPNGAASSGAYRPGF